MNLIEDAVAEREPDAALRVERRAHAALGARSPSRGGARPTGAKNVFPSRRCVLPCIIELQVISFTMIAWKVGHSQIVPPINRICGPALALSVQAECQ
jgi:hypothetical protein